MQAPPSHYMVNICGEYYDIFSKRFEQTAENLPGIGAFQNNFKNAVLSLTKSNVLMDAPDNYVYGQSHNEILMGYRMNGIPYPYHLGYDQQGHALPNPPVATSDDIKQWAHLLRSVENQRHEDNKALQMLWSWTGDFRRHTLLHIYRDNNISSREKILQIIQQHKACLQGHTLIIISRYKAQWHQQKTHSCTNLTTALKNLHILQNINNCIIDLDPTKTYSASDIIVELIPTLQHDNFSPVIKMWNNIISTNALLLPTSIQPSLEECFVVKNSLNDLECYTHVANTPQQQQSQETRRSTSLSSSTTPTKQAYAYAAISQEPSLPTSQSQLNQIVADAIAADRKRRARSPTDSPRDFQDRRNPTRDRSRDRSNERQQWNRNPKDRDNDRSSRRDRDTRRRDGSQPRPSQDQNRGDRSPSANRRSISQEQGKRNA